MSEEQANILVVDDLPEKLLVFTSILEELGQTLVTVRSGSDALREVLAREFAVILLDVNMPDIDGLETAKEARRRANFLAHASHELGASLDLEQGMRRLLDLVVPHVCDAAAVTIEKEPGKLDTLSAPATDFVPAPLASAIQVVMRDPKVLEISDQAGLAATLCYPLQVGDRVIGALALGYTGRLPRDRDMLEEVAGRAAIALDNARLYRSLKREITRSRQAEEELQDANRRKDEFLAMLSHELRNPLAPIRNAVELMRRVGSSEQRMIMARDVIDRQATQLTRLVDELLDVSRISQGKIVLKK